MTTRSNTAAAASPATSMDSSHSRDCNLWHVSHEGLELENPSLELNYDHLLMSVRPEKAPDEGEHA